MKSKVLSLLLCGLLQATYALAGWNIQSDKAYYMRCDYAPGFVGLSSEQGAGIYVLYQQTSGVDPTRDAFWYILPSGKGYAFKNAYSGQYLSWCSDYDLRNLDFVDEVVGDAQRWELVEGESGLVIRSLYDGKCLHMRNNYSVALYSSASDPKSIFHIYDETGMEIFYSDNTVLVESITLQADKTQVKPGDVVQINATVLPADATLPVLQWTSDNEDFSVTQEGAVAVNGYGTATITAAATDGSDVSASITFESVNPYMAYGEEMLYLRHRDSTVTVIPKDLVENCRYTGSLFTATLVNQESIELTGIVDTTHTEPADAPAFLSYKFNNKFNPQLFTDVETPTPGAKNIALTVAGIGKWLTASFKLADPTTQVYVGAVRQKSKYTRQSFAQPVVYRLMKPQWNLIRLCLQENGSYVRKTTPYERLQTVSVDFLTDHSTNEYKVPRIDITLTDNPGAWGSDNWIGMYGKKTYMPATIAIQGGGVFPDLAEMPMQIKGRGNTSWGGSSSSKNPYHFKFEEKQKPLGMTAGKHWILLANKQSGSMTSNAMGMKAANLFESAGNNHIVPVELYINGSYRGSYNLTERIGFSNNSIDLLDESCAAMMELDTYYDETIYSTNAYGVSTKIHIPDADDMAEEKTSLTYDQILTDYENMMATLYQGGDEYTKLVDAEYLARYLSACELMWNYELQHPKSVFLYSEDVTDAPDTDGYDPTPWIFGPLWDCDWGFGYDGSGKYYNMNVAEADFFGNLYSATTGKFWNDLRHNSEEVDRIYYRLWYDLRQRNVVQELHDYAQEYYDFAKESFVHNRETESSNYDGSDYLAITQRSQEWFAKRFEYVFNSLTSYEQPTEPETPETQGRDVMGDVNDDGIISTADAVTLLNALIGLPTETYYSARADIDSNGQISIGDVVMLCNLIMEQKASTRRRLHLPSATMHVYAAPATLQAYGEGIAKIFLEVDEGNYSSVQMDIALPQGVALEGVELPAELAGMTARTELLDNGSYRLILYADGSITLPTVPVALGLRLVAGEALQGRLHISAPTAGTSLGEEERLRAHSTVLTVQDVATDLPHLLETPEKKAEIYDLSGRRLYRPTTRGVFIRNGKKYVR